MSETRRCLVCNKTFVPCKSCIDNNLNGWRIATCCREHFQVNLIIANYTRKEKSREQCRDMLRSYIAEYGNIDFNDNVKSVVAEILTEEKEKQVDLIKTDEISISDIKNADVHIEVETDGVDNQDIEIVAETFTLKKGNKSKK